MVRALTVDPERRTRRPVSRNEMIPYISFSLQTGGTLSIALVTRRRTPSCRERAGTLLIGLLALCALVYDGFVLQTHRHARPAPAGYAGAPASALALDADDVCDLCTAVAAQDPFLPPQPTLLILPPTFAALAPVARAAYPRLVARAHIWRSRAPPEPVPLP